jgi:benzaldehyde dehydrogenase (NAD)
MPPLLNPEDWRASIYVDGTWTPAGGGTSDVVEPATGKVLTTAGLASPANVREAAERAAAAQPEWAAMLGAERARILRRAGDLLHEHGEEIGEWLQRETGSVRLKSKFEIFGSAEDLYEGAKLATEPVGAILVPGETAQENFAVRTPLGVAGVITPWNSPLILATRVLGPALALGNTVLLKPDTRTPITGGAVLARLFEEAGLPPGVLQVLPGGPEIGKAVATDPLVAKISFTGSTAVGRRVAELAAPLFKKVSLELGGNNAFIVLDDADLDAAASAGSFGSYFHQGQICFTAGRHVVHESVAKDYVERLAERAAALRIGNPHTDDVAIGPMIHTEQLERADRIVRDSVAAGARIVTGGTHEGLFYAPTVLDGVTPQMPAFVEEIFGPVAPVTTFSTDEDAIDLANRTEYGLVAAVQTRSLARGLAIARRLRTGIVHVNDQTIAHYSQSPIGGNSWSGNGSRIGGIANLDEWTQWRWVTFRDTQKRYPF